MVIAICGRRGVVVCAALRDVAVICWGENHGCLVCFRVLVVEVNHTSAAVRGGGLTGEEEEGSIRDGKRKMVKDMNKLRSYIMKLITSESPGICEYCIFIFSGCIMG